jgi:hypothetical protein
VNFFGFSSSPNFLALKPFIGLPSSRAHPEFLVTSTTDFLADENQQPDSARDARFFHSVAAAGRRPILFALGEN